MLYEDIWRKTLNDNEKVEYEFSVARRFRKFALINAIVWGFIWLAIFSTFSFGLGLFIFFPCILIGFLTYWYLKFNAYALTDRRILIHTGWLSTSSTSINYDKILEVSVSESFLNRKFYKSGNLSIKTGGLGHDVILKNIESPYEVKKTLDRLSHKG